jgi:hypothetical protein
LRSPDRSGTIPDVNQNPHRPQPETLLPLSEAAQRLGIAYDTARKRLKAGSLRGERRAGRWHVWVPSPEPDPDQTEPIPDALVAALQDDIAFLRQELAARTEEIRRRDHLIAGLIDRLPETLALPAAVGPQEPVRGPATAQDATPAGVRGQDTPRGLWARLRALVRSRG